MLSAHDRRTHNARRFTPDEARVLMARHGFRILRARYWTAFLFPLMLVHRLVERDSAGISLPFCGSLLVVAVLENLPYPARPLS
jgi:hypothetical protein